MGRGMRGAAAGAAALTLALALAACSDDDEDTTNASEDTAAEGGEGGEGGEAAEGDLATFCDALVEFNGMVMQVQIDDTSSAEDIQAAGEQLSPVWQQIADNAPDSVTDQVETLQGAITGLEEGDASAFNSDETFMTYTEMSGTAVEECDFETIEVTGVDYAFEGVPETLPAGTVAFNFVNASDTEEHEMILVRKADGVDLTWDEIIALPEEEADSKIEFGTAAFAPPGGEASAFGTLEPGSYAMICFIPVGGAEDGAPHFTQGMIQELTVE